MLAYRMPYSNNIQPWVSHDRWVRNLMHRHQKDCIDHNQMQARRVMYAHKQIEFYVPEYLCKQINNK